MHMADALISPAVGGTMLAATAALTAYSARKLKEEMDERSVPLMGVLGAFIFAAQMVNFTIPGTGSSGHLGGGMILAILLGPHAAFLTIASILTVQALFFADGGLLALGCNVINLGFFPCLVAYPLIYKKLTGGNPGKSRMLMAAILSSVVGLQMGAFGVVLETFFSGVSELPFRTFVLLMQPIHLAIGVIEGVITAAVVAFIFKARPELLELTRRNSAAGSFSIRTIATAILIMTVITGGVLSWFASSDPDGLEWAMLKTSGHEELTSPDSGIHSALADIQQKSAILPDYGFKKADDLKEAAAESRTVVNPGNSLSGIIGGVITMMLAALIGISLRRYHNRG